jgi:phosphoenolpyruvate-protein kinase (PTS system EI component)
MSEQPQSRKDKFTEKMFGFSPPEQPQEWKENERGLVIGDQVMALSHDKVKLILDAHSAALSVAYETRFDNILDAENKELKKQLANDRRRSKQAIEGIVETYEKLLDSERKLSEIRLALIKDHCETDTNIRELARPILGNFKVDGDSYGVPGLEDIVEELIKQLAAEKEAHAKTAKQLSDSFGGKQSPSVLAKDCLSEDLTKPDGVN